MMRLGFITDSGQRGAGNIFFRRRIAPRGFVIPGHFHQFHHASFPTAGWFHVRIWRPDGSEEILQLSGQEYAENRRLRARYEPETIWRPVRLPDLIGSDGLPNSQIAFVGPIDEPIIGRPIEFAPQADVVTVRKEERHEVMFLDDGIFDCVYAHQFPQVDRTEMVRRWKAEGLTVRLQATIRGVEVWTEVPEDHPALDQLFDLDLRPKAEHHMGAPDSYV